MQKYKYKAVDMNHKSYSGTYYAKDENDLRAQLAEQQLYLTSFSVKNNDGINTFFTFSGKVKTREITLFCRQFSNMINAGISIVDCIGILKTQPYSSLFKKVLNTVYEDLHSGLMLSEAYKRLDAIDDELAKNLDIAFDENLGYLTACPTNLGTGMRASVMMFLPALTESGKIKGLIDEVAELGLTVRGLYGEGSKAEGCMYQISNEITLGISEYDIIKSVEEAVLSICRLERELEEKLYVKRELITMDRAKKAYGVLTNAVLLSYNEFLSLIAEVKLGAMLGMINISDTQALDDLTVAVRPANLCVQYGRLLNDTDRDLFRAELVGKKLIKLKE